MIERNHLLVLDNQPRIRVSQCFEFRLFWWTHSVKMSTGIPGRDSLGQAELRREAKLRLILRRRQRRGYCGKRRRVFTNLTSRPCVRFRRRSHHHQTMKTYFNPARSSTKNASAAYHYSYPTHIIVAVTHTAHCEVRHGNHHLKLRGRTGRRNSNG